MQSRDPAAVYELVAPYLRVAFVVTWLAAALAKVNSGFLDPLRTCAVWVLESIPAVAVPTFLVPPVIAGSLAVELAVPLLLLFHRTRPAAVVLGFGFHLVSAFAGHASFSGFAWSFYLLFLSPAAVAAAVATARRALPSRTRELFATAAAHPVRTALGLGAVWWLGWTALPDAASSAVRNWGAALFCAAWMGLCGLLLWRVRRHWVRPSGPPANLRPVSAAMLLGVALLVATAATPYVGLKSRASLTMFSNLQTEPGNWNHLLVPEGVRAFGWQDGEVRYLGSDSPALDATVAENGSAHTVLLDLRRIADDHPNATVRYELDGVQRVAAPVSADPVLGAPVSPVQEWFGAMRPFAGGTCQH